MATAKRGNGALTACFLCVALAACGSSGSGTTTGAGGSGGGGAGAGGGGAAGVDAGTGGHGGGAGGGSGGTGGGGGASTTDAGHGDTATPPPADAAGDRASDATGDRASDAAADRAGDGGGDAGTTLASPCPPAPTLCKILPLGDSITDGFTVAGGYRIPLFSKTNAAGQHLTFVGSQMNGPATVDGVAFPQHHEGHSGYTIDNDTFDGRNGISPLTPGSITTYQPHIILLMIGTNDVNLQNDLPNAPARLGTLLDSIFTTSPGVTVILAQINPSQDDTLNARIMTYNAAIPALVSARAAAGKHIVLVDMYGAITGVANYKTALLADMLHPNATGYQKMSDVWYAALSPMLH
jgi:hypothetical protein